ncbi:hypothetical protein D3C80_1983840 [compost metagenome]
MHDGDEQKDDPAEMNRIDLDRSRVLDETRQAIDETRKAQRQNHADDGAHMSEIFSMGRREFHAIALCFSRPA